MDKTPSIFFNTGRELGAAEYMRDKYRAALERIAGYEISDNLNYYNARAMIELARETLKE